MESFHRYVHTAVKSEIKSLLQAGNPEGQEYRDAVSQYDSDRYGAHEKAILFFPGEPAGTHGMGGGDPGEARFPFPQQIRIHAVSSPPVLTGFSLRRSAATNAANPSTSNTMSAVCRTMSDCGSGTRSWISASAVRSGS